MPKVSVCIPTYNRSNYLQYAINSVLQQTYDDFELIICDDGSTDNTPEIIDKINDSRLIYVRHPQNIGRSKNMSSGFEKATGKYFIKFDDDDALENDFLSNTVAVLDQYSSVDFVCTNHWIIDSENNKNENATKLNSQKWGKNKLSKGIINNLIYETFIMQSLQVGSTLFRYQCLAEVDYMNPQADGCEDFDLLVRLAIADKKGYFLPEHLMQYRFHNQQNSLRQSLHFLQAKKYCLESYNFVDQDIENKKYKKLSSINLSLGLRLIEAGKNKEGRKLIKESAPSTAINKRVILGLILSYLPNGVSKGIFKKVREMKPKDYADQVRKNSNG